MPIDLTQFHDDFFLEAAELLDRFEAHLLALDVANPAPMHIDDMFRCIHTLKGNSGTLHFTELTAFAHDLEAVLHTLQTSSSAVVDVTLLLAAHDCLRQQLQQLQLTPNAPSLSHWHMVQAKLRGELTNETVVSEQCMQSVVEPVMRVKAEKVDRLVDQISEIVIRQAHIQQQIEQSQSDQCEVLTVAITDMMTACRQLKATILDLRMLPIHTLFARYPRVVRDVALKRGKTVRLQMYGHATALDRVVLERLYSPLLHLVHNAIDHGIEEPVVRRARGKSAEGLLILRASAEHGYVFITVEDDGCGIDWEQIYQRAAALNIAAANPTDYLFSSGFSTAKQITTVSGRGVGLDAVRQDIQRIGGTITVQSTKGKGSKFSIQLPLTLAVLEGQLVMIAEQIFVIPLSAMTEIVPLHALNLEDAQYQLHGKTIIVLDPAEIFALPRKTEPQFVVMTARQQHQRLGILVDKLLTQQHVVVKDIAEHYKAIEGIMGATVLGNGNIAFIMDVANLLG